MDNFDMARTIQNQILLNYGVNPSSEITQCLGRHLALGSAGASSAEAAALPSPERAGGEHPYAV
jgi:hypothetical protein